MYKFEVRELKKMSSNSNAIELRADGNESDDVPRSMRERFGSLLGTASRDFLLSSGGDQVR